MRRDTRVSDYHTNVFYSIRDGGYIADIPDLKYCSAFGETPEEALQEAMLAKAAWLEAALAREAPRVETRGTEVPTVQGTGERRRIGSRRKEGRGKPYPYGYVHMRE